MMILGLYSRKNRKGKISFPFQRNREFPCKVIWREVWYKDASGIVPFYDCYMNERQPEPLPEGLESRIKGAFIIRKDRMIPVNRKWLISDEDNIIIEGHGEDRFRLMGQNTYEWEQESSKPHLDELIDSLICFANQYHQKKEV